MKYSEKNWDYDDLPSKIEDLISQKFVSKRDIVGSDDSYRMVAPIRLFGGSYENSPYVSEFLGKPIGKSSIKEDNDMSRSVMSLVFEDLENTRGQVGLGDDDDLTGAPGFNKDNAMNKIGDLIDVGDDIDDELDRDDAQNHLFGDDRIKGDKAVVAQESSFIRTKDQYYNALGSLFNNLVEISILSYLPASEYKSDSHKIASRSMYESVVYNEAPVLWESLSGPTQEVLYDKISYFRECFEQLLNTPTKRAAGVVENYLMYTNAILSEIDESLTRYHYSNNYPFY
jgi:hypothetical protein